MVLMPVNSTHAAPGNPHFQYAESALGVAQAHNTNEAKASIAVARATLAQAFEQRTTSLIAVRDDLETQWNTPETVELRRQVRAQINCRLGLEAVEASAAAAEPDPAVPTTPVVFDREYFDRVDGRWVRIGKHSRGDEPIAVLSTPNRPDVNISRQDAPALAAAILRSVGLDPATADLTQAGEHRA